MGEEGIGFKKVFLIYCPGDTSEYKNKSRKEGDNHEIIPRTKALD